MGHRTVWALTSGSYSDYGIEAIFTTEKAALAASKLKEDEYDWHDYNVESFILYDEVPEEVTLYEMVEVIVDGSPSYVSTTKVTSKTKYPWMFLWGTPRARPHVRYVRAPVYKGKAGRLEVHGNDKQAVQQAFSDQRGVILDALSKDEKPRQVRP